MLELLHALTLVSQQSHAQGPNFRRQLLLQHAKRRLTLGGDQNPFALGQEVADDVCNGMALAGAGRALHYHPVAGFQLLDDSHLLVVVRQGKEKLFGVGAGERGRQPSKRHCDFRLDLGIPDLDKAPQNVGQAYGLSDFLLQPLNVLQEDVFRAPAGEEHPGVGDA